MTNKQTKSHLISNDFKKKIIKLHYLKKWRKKLRKTKYLAYKKRFSIYQTDYSSNYSIAKPFFFKSMFLKKNHYINYILIKKLKSNLWVNSLVADKNITEMLNFYGKITGDSNTILLNWFNQTFKKNKTITTNTIKTITIFCKYKLKLKTLYNILNIFLL